MNHRNFNSQFAENVARLCYEKFEKLPKSGKPVQNEWTYLAAIVKDCDNNLEIVSIATGSKCIGKNKLSSFGDIINDSHAEVLARRGFMKYLYEQISCFKLSGKSEVLYQKNEKGKYRILEHIKFHLFSSHVPCGDAAIFPKYMVQEIDHNDSENKDNIQARKKRKLNTDTLPHIEVGVIVEDIHRTGAKCFAEERNADKMQPGTDYHVVGCVRTKPGRGDPTLSVSCSDKILRWNCVGIQGALLSLLLDPIYLSSIIIGNHNCLYSYDALYRAVIGRNSEISQLIRPPVLLHTNLEFQFCKHLRGDSSKPSPCGIVWCNVPYKNHEVIVQGRRLGWTKKTSVHSEPVSISKKSFLNYFKTITENAFDNLNYYDIKLKATWYQNMWKKVVMALTLWTRKNVDLLKFQ